MDIKKQYAGVCAQNKFLREANEALSAELRRLRAELGAAERVIEAVGNWKSWHDYARDTESETESRLMEAHRVWNERKNLTEREKEEMK